MRPLISYYGGKQRMSSRILPLFPQHKIYVEPFAGGAALLFAKEPTIVSNNNNYREVLNDLNNQIITLYRVARDNPDALLKKLELTPYSKADHSLAKEILEGTGYSDLDIAWAVTVQCNQSFASKMFGGWGRSKMSQNSASSLNNWRNDLSVIFDRLKDVYLDSIDAIDCIDKWDHPDTLFYIDPPYPETDQGHYKGYTMDDFKQLIEKLETVKGSFILSCYPSVSVHAPDDWEKFDFDTSMSASKASNGKRLNDKRTESVWRKLNNQCQESQQLSLFDV